MSSPPRIRPRPGSRRSARDRSEAAPPTLTCPTRQTLDRLADRWTVVLLDQLENGPRRFGQLRDAADGISEKMLTQTLRSLERDGFVTRRSDTAKVPQVWYLLTPLGRSVLEPLAAVRSWAHQNIDGIERSRLSFDAEPR
ncbi:winged helix-turn-helix transcriptional regulator [Actinoplanes sp. HUAS TT8]|uniref:winged helix-turn-helix transcriptional regulator n=1 Tax=Actinoplanes sp. HUAS TT8 TaxID=3447453 RepID=UPI003F51B1B9